MVLSPRLLSFRRPAGRSVSSFSVIACTFPRNKCFQPALAPTLAGIWLFWLPIASRHVFSGHVHLVIPADTKQHTITSLRTSPVRLSQPLTETKYRRDGRRYFYKNHYYRELTSGVSNWAFSGTLSTSAKSHSSSYGSLFFLTLAHFKFQLKKISFLFLDFLYFPVYFRSQFPSGSIFYYSGTQP